jgi:hypothetical protein
LRQESQHQQKQGQDPAPDDNAQIGKEDDDGGVFSVALEMFQIPVSRADGDIGHESAQPGGQDQAKNPSDDFFCSHFPLQEMIY